MNAKVKKIEAELIKTKTRIAELQNRVAELEQQKTELENTEIISVFRSANIAPEDLIAAIAAFKKNTYGIVRQEEKKIEKP